MSSTQSQFSALFSRHVVGGPYTIQDIERVPGDVWFVDSGATNTGATTAHGYTPDKPFSTLAYAMTSGLVGSGDVVFLMPSHAETISGAGTITMSTAGVKVIGLGAGATRPTFTWSAAASTWLVTAASCTVENILCLATTGVDTTQGILVTAADVTFRGIEAREPSATGQWVDFLTFHTGAARGRVQGLRVIGFTTGDAGESALQVTAVVDSCRFEDVWITGEYGAGCIETTAAATNILIRGTYTENVHATQDGGIVLNAGTTGLIVDPVHKSATHDADGFNLAFVGAGAAWFNPLVVNLAGERGGAWGTASTA